MSPALAQRQLYVSKKLRLRDTDNESVELDPGHYIAIPLAQADAYKLYASNANGRRGKLVAHVTLKPSDLGDCTVS